MDNTIIINPGSSSKKFSLYKDRELVLSASVERTKNGSKMCASINGVQLKDDTEKPYKFHESLGNFLELAKEKEIISKDADINRVVIRVVAPGSFFQQHAVINDYYLKRLRDRELFAPLHIPHILSEIEATKKLIPHSKMVAASDSAFHATVPDFIRRYSLNEDKSKKYDLYRFGYHGLSVSSVVRRIHAVTGVDPKKAIVCHIGSGVSVTAIKDGKSFDTTMGYGPSNGLLMGSRAGDLDSGALLAIMQAQNLKPLDAQTFINNEGGLRGLTGEIDLRILLERRAQGNEIATSAIKSYVYNIQKAIGGFVAGMGGLDMLVFTATAGERSAILRYLITDELRALGIEIDLDKNELCISRDGIISHNKAKIKVAVIRTEESDEMLRVEMSEI